MFVCDNCPILRLCSVSNGVYLTAAISAMYVLPLTMLYVVFIVVRYSFELYNAYNLSNACNNDDDYDDDDDVN